MRAPKLVQRERMELAPPQPPQPTPTLNHGAYLQYHLQPQLQPQPQINPVRYRAIEAATAAVETTLLQIGTSETETATTTEADDLIEVIETTVGDDHLAAEVALEVEVSVAAEVAAAVLAAHQVEDHAIRIVSRKVLATKGALQLDQEVITDLHPTTTDELPVNAKRPLAAADPMINHRAWQKTASAAAAAAPN